MHHQLFKVRAVDLLSDYTLKVHFDDSSEQTIDFAPLLKGEIYGPLKQLSLFRQVKIDPETHTLCWPNGADFDPETLHNWNLYSSRLIEKTKHWGPL
ncbi:MAG: DUF2442 domain-containing protein [Deltaproteobacteria bacterium]|nr:DUF2442 domain-containing protein [Deltaproteobacteria bacterium]